MKLVRVGAPGQERPGLIDGEGRIRDLSGVIDDVAGEHITNAGLDKLRALDVSTLPLLDGELRYGAAVGQIGKFICVGLNYADHAAESGMDVPKMPILFMKATTAVTGPNDTVIIRAARSRATGKWNWAW
ncbi:2-hydroxyhepta-2,4-diene-1,7-dioate isomerase [Xanthomonas arboricola pv. pruni str. MAFF 311562]|uniref:2-hydroxyhepta-2,4-diene-1,7-dioate isomerase n=1 Tax=Xanthomonas arboricola pv. pruni str. MAFF 311562 TaxID=1414836 RepID=W4S2T8_9XANT|nr:2-hydroxyhepta-2,4-diene-1,7-dioate isomerase [Xanthomonas arboricola pv. pruni str. MAFF 311562]